MLSITIPASEYYDEDTCEFMDFPEKCIELEHSLASLYAWESKWHKPFLATKMNAEETIDYIRCMTLTPNVDESVYERITKKDLDKILNYIDDSHTATWFSKDVKEANKGKGSGESITAELIYYWMTQSNIPFTCDKWHLNQLLTLIQVCSLKNSPPKKMSKRDIARRNKQINEARLAKRKR